MANKHYDEYDLDWNGKRVGRGFAEAARGAIDETTGLCVKKAATDAPWRTGNLSRSIKLQEAEITDEEVFGVWGSWDVVYALVVELGLYKDPEFIAKRQAKIRRSGAKRATAERRDSKRSPGVRKNTGKTHFLRGAVDEFYPGLSERIAKRYDAQRT